MSTVRRPRRPVPQRVYWVRRAMVLAVALLLVFGIGKLLGGSGSDSTSTATKASSESSNGSSTGTTTAPATLGPVAPSAATSTTPKKAKQTAGAPLVAPSGDCDPADVSATPVVDKAVGGGKITILMRLQGTQPACTFAVSHDSLVLKITSGSDRIWSSQDCPASIASTSVVVRSNQTVDVPVSWSGRRSDETCSAGTSWAQAGFYHAYGAVLGSTASDVQFEVTLPGVTRVTKTAKPKPSPTATPTGKATPSQPAKPSKSSGSGGTGSACGGDNAAGTC